LSPGNGLIHLIDVLYNLLWPVSAKSPHARQVTKTLCKLSIKVVKRE